jgi:hypothetical protein
VGQQINNAGAATASGYIGQANAWSNGISGATNNLTNFAMMNSMSGYGGSNPATGPGTGSYNNNLFAANGAKG